MPLKITLEMLGAMKKPLGQGPVEVEVREGSTVRDFMVRKLGYAPGHVDLLAYYLDDKKGTPSAVLTAGCRLKVLMIIGGG
jgi:hypothetical protein